jgi:hypothetical protein
MRVDSDDYLVAITIVTSELTRRQGLLTHESRPLSPRLGTALGLRAALVLKLPEWQTGVQ